MNTKPKYYPGIKLAPGSYDILVTQSGYYPNRQWLRIRNQDVTLPVVLEEKVKPVPYSALSTANVGDITTASELLKKVKIGGFDSIPLTALLTFLAKRGTDHKDVRKDTGGEVLIYL